jgi:hypothetical protein
VSRTSIVFALLLAAAFGGAASTRITTASATPAVDQTAAQQAKVVWPDEGPKTWAPRPTVAAITANDLRTRLYQIADDSMMGRDAITLGNWKVAEYIASEFKRLKLQPAGEGGTYFQEVHYGPLSYDSLTVQLAVDGKTLHAGTDWAPMQPATATLLRGDFNSQNIQTMFGGRWGDTTTALDPSIVRGRAVVFLLPPPAVGAGGADSGRGAGGRGAGGRGRGGGRGGRGGAANIRDLRAQTAGATAVLLVADSLDPNPLDSAFAPRTALMPFMAPVTAGATLTAPAGAALFDRPLAQLSVGATGKMVSGRWTYEYHRPQYFARNIIAVLPGSDPALRGQYVLVGAHNDHVGFARAGPDHDSLRAFNRIMRPQGANDRPGPPTAEQQHLIDSMIARARTIRPPRRDTIMNGADDDGSGTAVLLEIAERFVSEPAPKRSIIFISHVGEEKGLVGSSYFVDHPTIPRDSIVAAHNMDMLGKGRVTDVKFGGPAQVQTLGARRLSAEFGDLIDSLNAVRSETMAIDYSWDRTNALNRFCRSDQVNYFRYAIPVTYFSSGYAEDYHQATDEPQYVDYDHSARIGRFVHDIMVAVANRPKRLAVLPVEQRDLSARCGS